MEIPESEKAQIRKRIKKAHAKTIKDRIKEMLPHISDEDAERIVVAVTKASLEVEERKYYALEILDRARKYVQGYLKDYKIEVELKESAYPAELRIKVWY